MARARDLSWRVALAVLLLSVAWPAAASPSGEARFERDLEALTEAPHRLSGTPEGRRAADYIASRLREAGIQHVLPLDMPVWQMRVEQAELLVEGRTIPLLPLQPNIIAAPVTPPEGLTGRLMYVGDGRLHAYGSTPPESIDAGGDASIVVMDYDSGDQWEDAFALGADAVIFVGRGDETPIAPKQAGVPGNQVRLYARAEDLEGIDLARVDRATIRSRVTWDDSIPGRNILAFIPGTDPGFSPDRDQDEMLVLATHYDSFGAVPHLSPGARAAGNVAALLEAAEAFRRDAPKRDVLLVFVDNQARHHQGARAVYDALMMSPAQHEQLLAHHDAERRSVAAMRDVLLREGLAFMKGDEVAGRRPDAATAADTVRSQLNQTLSAEAENLRDDVSKTLQVLRLSSRDPDREPTEDLEARERAINDELMRWDAIRRTLHKGDLPLFVAVRESEASGEWDAVLRPAYAEAYEVQASRYAALAPEDRAAARAEAERYLQLFDLLRRRTLERFGVRLAELERLEAVDRQRSAIRELLADKWIVLHATYNLSGDAGTWAVVVGDWTDRLFRRFHKPTAEGDAPGYYGRVLSAFRESVAALRARGDRLSAEERPLLDPGLGLTVAPGPFFSSGYAAGLFGIYNVSLMTAHDARVRDGHPADTVDRLAWRNLRKQALQGTRVLRDLADRPSLSLPRVFKPFALSKYPSWNAGRAAGDYVGLQVSGSLSEHRPASGALLAIWSAEKIGGHAASDSWEWLSDGFPSPSFTPILLTRVDANGRFPVIAHHEHMMNKVMTLGAYFDQQGRITAITNRLQQAQAIADAMRVDMIAAEGFILSTIPVYDTRPSQLRLLKATGDSPFRDTRGLWGQSGPHLFAYVSDQSVENALKLFQPMGPVVLGGFTDEHAYGAGVPQDQLDFPRRLSAQTAEDLWRLNESRLGQLRERGVTSAPLEFLHSRAQRALEKGLDPDAATPVALREAALMRSAALSHRVYQPLRQVMDDLVHTIVILLLLAIPFAFALERLVTCATTVYGRIAGFTFFFLLTFGILYLTHPGFAIASTPIIIFLAFAIILLSSLVIYILLRKFQTELKAMQGQGVGVHSIEVSRAGALLAAIAMGMSTMRRRPTRTTLTAITVVALTFTILSFASFSREIGVRAIPVGLKSDDLTAEILIRQLDYTSVPEGVLTMLHGKGGDGGLLAAHWWLAREEPETPAYTVARVDDGRGVQLEAVMGVSPAEVERWPELAAALGDRELPDTLRSLNAGGVYLPFIVQQMLDLDPGQEVLVNGRRATFAGALDSQKLQRLRHLDGGSVIPVDFQTAGLESASQPLAGAQPELLLADDVEKDFVHLSADQVAVASADTVQRLGGQPHLISVYPGLTPAGDPIDPAELGREIARVVVMPVWAAGLGGVERLLLTVLTEVSGGLALFVPLLLGGLIIFGTLLGSISDREKEIYTFSALGLSPGHVGVLFFAEATVYAIVGGMGGQLLAQFVALGAAGLARAGYIQPANINYSSTNALFAIGVVMATVLVSAIYPAVRASKSANPGLARAWKMPPAQEDEIRLTFPFTVSAYDITGVVSFLAEHFRRHDDAGLGNFAASDVRIGRNDQGNLFLESDLALAPFDLGVTQHFVLTAVPSEIEGVDEVAIEVHRLSGARGDWYRANKVFMRDLRKQFLLWRTLSTELIEHYRMETLETLGEADGQPTRRELADAESRAAVAI